MYLLDRLTVAMKYENTFNREKMRDNIDYFASEATKTLTCIDVNSTFFLSEQRRTLSPKSWQRLLFKLTN